MRWSAVLLLLSACATASDLPAGDEADADTDTDTDSDTDTDADADTGPVVDCAALSVTECKATPACRVLTAFPILDLGDGEWCVDNSSSEVGCGQADDSCPPYTTWGAHPDSTGSCFMFGDCQPDGWGACAEPSMRTTNGC